MQVLSLRLQYTREGVRIVQVYSDRLRIQLPEAVGNHPVTEIGPYCFSASGPRLSGDSFLWPEDSGGQGAGPSLPPVSGKDLEEVFLPSSVRLLHNGAFYNCRRLRTLGAGPRLSAIGSDVFTNCSRLTRLVYAGGSQEAAGLSLLLGRLEHDLEVSCPDFTLFFPEYYEWLDEVTPAHLFSRSIHGEGFRMRKCIRDGQIDFGKYDACFESALRTETEETLLKTAICRLRWPSGLQDSSRHLYRDTLTKGHDTAVAMAVTNRDLPLLIFLYTAFSLPGTSFRAGLDRCIAADWSQGAAWLLDAGKKRPGRSFADKDYSF